MEQLHYADEVRPISEVPIPSGEVKDNELKLAVNLVQQLATEDFRPEQYRDEVHDRVMELINQKIEGQDITRAPEEAPAAQIIDLMAALKASLEKTEPAPAKKTAAKKTTKRKTGT
jgi:DNA end-binding protein Ku